MSSRARIAAVVATTALAAAATTGCAHRVDPGRVVVKTVVVTPTPTSTPSPPPSSTAPPSPSTSNVADVTHRPPPPKVRHLPGTCASQLPADDVAHELGQQLRGPSTFVVGKPDSTIGRMTYLNCKYGVSHAKGPTVEVTVSLYRTGARATQRIESTQQDFTYHGASATTTTVAKHPASLLLGANLLFYGPTIVLARGQRTIAVTLRPGTNRPAPLLEKLGKLALLRTA